MMQAKFEIGQRVRIITTGARLLNRATIKGEDCTVWYVVPDGCRQQRFSKTTLALLPNRRHKDKWPKIAP